MKCSLYGEKGLPHSYRRGDFKHDVLGALYACADIGGIMVPGHVLCRDLWAEQAARAGLVSADAAKDYAAKLTECLSAFAMDENADYDAIYLAARRLRLSVFGRDIIDAADRLSIKYANGIWI